MNLISDMEVRIDYFDQQRKADFAKQQELQGLIDLGKRNHEYKELAFTDRIEALNDALQNEREIREHWIGKFEGE